MFYKKKLFVEGDLSNSKSKTYSKATHSIEEIIAVNISYFKSFELNIIELDKLLSIMYWLYKIHKRPIGATFIAASKNATESHSLIEYQKLSKWF